MPAVSIITPCYNAARYVARTVQSVRGQTFGDWEQIVVDDGSTDWSAEAVRAILAVEPRLRLLRQPNGGRGNACNNGLRRGSADSRYVYFLDADDLLDPRMLQVMVAYMDAHPDVGLAHCDIRVIDGEGNDRGVATGWPWQRFEPTRFGVRQLPGEEPRTPFASLFLIAVLMSSMMFMRRDVFERLGGWDESFGNGCEDTDLALRFALRSEVHYVPEPLVHYRRHDSQWSSDTDRFGPKLRKFDEKWRECRGLTESERRVVEAAWRFREGRFVPYVGARSAMERLRKGQLVSACRFLGGAAKRYARSFVPGVSY